MARKIGATPNSACLCLWCLRYNNNILDILVLPAVDPCQLKSTCLYTVLWTYLQATAYFILYMYSIHRAICRPSDRPVEKPLAEIRTLNGRIYIVAGTLTTRPSHLPGYNLLISSSPSWIVIYICCVSSIIELLSKFMSLECTKILR